MRLIDANEVVKAILSERDKIPRTITRLHRMSLEPKSRTTPEIRCVVVFARHCAALNRLRLWTPFLLFVAGIASIGNRQEAKLENHFQIWSI